MSTAPLWLVAVRNELRKAVHRRALRLTWAGFVLVCALVSIQILNAESNDGGPLAMADLWPSALGGLGGLAGIMAGVAFALLLGSEWDWRTGRQNVIDGLGRGEWFTGKLGLLVVIAGAFVTTHVLTTGIGVLVVGEPLDGGWIELWHVKWMLGLLAGLTCTLTIALVTGLGTSGAGAATALFLVWIAAEPLMSAGLREYDDWRGWIGEHLPAGTFARLQQRPTWDPVFAERAAADPELAARMVPASATMLEALVWVVILTSSAWLLYRRRDL